MALFFTLLRIVFYKTLLERIPKWYKLNKEDAEKFPEAAFRTITYSGLWTFTCYAIFKTDLFYIPYSAWTGWIPGIQMPNDMYWVYMLEMGFYLHMMYATTYVETVRKDYVVQMLHHVLTLVLLLYSYSVRFHNIGVFVIFIHDIADILLELAKCFIYFKVMNGVPNKVADMLANITFVLFVLQWVLFRLYWFGIVGWP
jgi:ceramide synthetase